MLTLFFEEEDDDEVEEEEAFFFLAERFFFLDFSFVTFTLSTNASRSDAEESHELLDPAAGKLAPVSLEGLSFTSSLLAIDEAARGPSNEKLSLAISAFSSSFDSENRRTLILNGVP